MLFIDIDHFKSINDRFRHSEGDRVLCDLVARTQKILRTTDMLGRMGGKEFLVILPDTCAKEAAQIAERIRLVLETPSEGLTLYSVSIGSQPMSIAPRPQRSGASAGI
ncbi:GGDEF domain-containing protein [Caldichromatium japonicum]|uniref:diguanylate cyclase n=1 Tax=Caldichromatium japonicum TaxID=2699430 RepID=A0A6G7VBF0_9GAMM|nr:GGDEF domain-containing protein [Caldichromatium japonicum]